MAQPHLGRSFYRRDSVTLARALLGQQLVRMVGKTPVAGLIVETEAYLGIPDRAAHTYGGRRTQRNESMWQDGGHAYVYFTYGMHHCLNVVSAVAGEPVAVLIRALEPTNGLELMYAHRNAARRDRDLCSGPARLCQALAIDRGLDGADLTRSDTLFIEQRRRRALPGHRIARSARIGVGYAGQWARKPLRFYLRDSAHVSKTR